MAKRKQSRKVENDERFVIESDQINVQKWSAWYSIENGGTILDMAPKKESLNKFLNELKRANSDAQLWFNMRDQSGRVRKWKLQQVRRLTIS